MIKTPCFNLNKLKHQKNNLLLFPASACTFSSHLNACDKSHSGHANKGLSIRWLHTAVETPKIAMWPCISL